MIPPAAPNPLSPATSSRGRRFAFALITLIIALGVAEVTLRATEPWLRRLAQPLVRRSFPLQPYQKWDERRDVHVLRPNVRMTRIDLGLKKSLVGGTRLAGERDDDVVLTVNDAGLRGDPLDPSHAQPRILCIGDSCTFGWFDGKTWPESLAQALTHDGYRVEVLNGGVQGYSTRDVCARLDEFAGLQPQITLLYIGWNDLQGEHATAPLYRTLATARAAHLGWHAIRRALHLRKEKNPDPHASEVAELETWVPRFLPRVEAIIDRMQAAGSDVMLCTLPGLYTTRESPSQRALNIGVLPDCVNNPFVMATMTERYNACLREIAARRGLSLIDFELFAATSLLPRDTWFRDSVHLGAAGRVQLGRAAAEIVRTSPRLTPPSARR